MASRDLSAGEEVAYVPPVCMLRNEGYLKLAAELRQQMQLAAEVPDMAFFAAYVATLPVRAPPGLGSRNCRGHFCGGACFPQNWIQFRVLSWITWGIDALDLSSGRTGVTHVH